MRQGVSSTAVGVTSPATIRFFPCSLFFVAPHFVQISARRGCSDARGFASVPTPACDIDGRVAMGLGPTYGGAFLFTSVARAYSCLSY